MNLDISITALQSLQSVLPRGYGSFSFPSSSSGNEMMVALELLPEQTEKLSIAKHVFYGATGELREIQHGFYESSQVMVLASNGITFANGAIAVGDSLLLESITPGFVSPGIDDATVNPIEMLSPKIKDLVLSHQQNKPLVLSDSVYAVLYTCPCRNFGHWHFNFLSSLSSLKKHVPNCKLLLPPLSGYQLESLKLFGLCEKDYVINLEPRPVVAEKMLLLSSSWAWNGLSNLKPSLAIMKDIANEFYSETPCSTKQNIYPGRIYVSRIDDAKRSLLNEQEVIALFEQRGFAIIHPLRFSYSELAKIFAHADIVSGPCGSAMTRVGYCKPGFTFVQLTFSGSHDYLWHRYASFAGASRSYVYEEADQNISRSPTSLNANEIGGWTINIEALNDFLNCVD